MMSKADLYLAIRSDQRGIEKYYFCKAMDKYLNRPDKLLRRFNFDIGQPSEEWKRLERTMNVNCP